MFEVKKATSIEEIDQATNLNEPLWPDHPFYTDLSDLRGDFEEQTVLRSLNYRREKFNARTNSRNKTLLFLCGMRGTGKTTELARYAKRLEHPEGFFCVTCNIDEGLNRANLEYMDILVFQLERLTTKLESSGIAVDTGILGKMEKWFSERTEEVNKALGGSLGLEVGIGAEKNNLLASLLGIFGSLKMGVTGSFERTNTVRRVLQNRFNDFADIFNEYIEESNLALRQKGVGQEILFIVDGLEKTLSTESRRKIIIDESGYIQKIKAYTIFTLPIELMKERNFLKEFSQVESFPFVKLQDAAGKPIAAAYERFKAFIGKRMDLALFESDALLERIIEYSGGSPRELLRIIETCAHLSGDEELCISSGTLDKALARLAKQLAQHLDADAIRALQALREATQNNTPVLYDAAMENLLEHTLVMEYNAGNIKRPNPLLQLSEAYRYYVLEQH